MGPTIFELVAPPSYKDFFLQIRMVQHLYFYNKLVSSFKKCPFGLETARFNCNQFSMVPYSAEFEVLKFLS